MSSDKEFYQIISDELSSKAMDAAIWTQAIAVAEGNADKTQAAYIRLRFADLKKSASSPTVLTFDVDQAKIESKVPENGISGIRSELTRKLQALGKTSLYTVLSLHPDASDAVVASAIVDFDSRAMIGSVANSAEFKYAKATLSDPKLREQYDRKLLGSISNGGTAKLRTYNYEPAEKEYSLWESRKTSIIIGVLSLALLGYLGFGSFNERKNHEIQKEVIDVQRDAVHAITDIDQQKVQAQIDLQNQNMANQNANAEQAQTQQILQQARIQDMQNMQMDRQRQQQEQIANMNAQRQQQTDNMAVQRQQRYWACINQQLSIPRVTSSDAYARCAGLQ